MTTAATGVPLLGQAVTRTGTPGMNDGAVRAWLRLEGLLKELVEAGKVTPVIDGTYPLSGTPEAIGHVGEGHARGTVVITVDHVAA